MGVKRIAVFDEAVNVAGVEDFRIKESLFTIGLMDRFRLKSISVVVFGWGVDMSWWK